MTVDAVIFDWGGTLTPWRTYDARVWWRVATHLVPPEQVDEVAAALSAADEHVWRRSREEHRSGTLEEVFTTAGVPLTDFAYQVYYREWEWATITDPEAPPTLESLRERGIRIGVLSNTYWPRERHEEIFARDGVSHLIDGAVFTSEIPWTKPHPEAFFAAMAAIGVTDPRRCVFVGDRPFEDIFGAKQVGMRAVLVPHSQIPDNERGHTEGVPDAVIERLGELVPIVDTWRGVSPPPVPGERRAGDGGISARTP